MKKKGKENVGLREIRKTSVINLGGKSVAECIVSTNLISLFFFSLSASPSYSIWFTVFILLLTQKPNSLVMIRC